MLCFPQTGNKPGWGGTAAAGDVIKISVTYTYTWNNPYTGVSVTDTYITNGFSYVENIIFPAGIWAFASAYGNISNATIDYYFRDIEAQMVSKYGKPTKRPYEDSDYWMIEENGTRIQVKLGKGYPQKGGDNSRVFVNYDNLTFYEKEKQRAANKDF